MTREPNDTVLLELVGEVLGLLDLDDFGPGLLESMLRAVPAKWASLNEIGPDRVESLVVPDLEQKWFPLFAELAHENPLYRRWQATRDGRAYRFSDVATRAELEATRLYREVYAELGIEHQVAFSLPAEPDRVLAVALHREDRDFSDAERDFLNRARPFLIQAYRNAVAYSNGVTRAAPPALHAVLLRAGLTARQAEVVRLVALGCSNRDVGAHLGLSERTVQKHLQHAFRALAVKTRSDAARRAWDLAGYDLAATP